MYRYICTYEVWMDDTYFKTNLVRICQVLVCETFLCKIIAFSKSLFQNYSKIITTICLKSL